MTDVTPTERDSSGRFVKAEADVTPIGEDDTVHPMAILLFGWVEAKRTPAILLGVVLIVSMLLIAADLSLAGTGTGSDTRLTGFFGMVGFVSVALAILISWPLSRVLRRSDDFYGEGDTTPARVEDEEQGT